MIDYFYKPEELDGKTAKFGKALHITKTKLYDKPKELSDLEIIAERLQDLACELEGTIRRMKR